MADRLVVTGGTGFLGSFVVPELVRRRRRVTCVVRPSGNVSLLTPLEVELRTADLGDERALRRAFEGCDTLVNLASLGFGHAPNIARAARLAGVRRAVFIGTTAIFTSLPARSRRARLEAEAWLRESGLAYTLLRPTMIYGSERDRNVARLIRYLARYPAIPVPGSGRALQQPVYVGDVAAAVLASLERSASVGKSYNLAGPRPLPFNELIDTTARALGRRVLRVHLPLGPVVVAARVLGLLPVGPRIRAEQMLRLNEDKVFDIQTARADLSFDPLELEEGIRIELASMRLASSPRTESLVSASERPRDQDA